MGASRRTPPLPWLKPERMAALKDMLAELNTMLAAREAGEQPDFAGFMERHGQFFPGNPQSLDELLEQMARSMAQMQALLSSMSEEQRQWLTFMANCGHYCGVFRSDQTLCDKLREWGFR